MSLSFQAGEDKVSYERHTKQLQVEFMKTKQNPQVVAELMKKTFPFRRAEILEQPSDLAKLFEKFPFLQEVDHVSYAVHLCTDIVVMSFTFFTACSGVRSDVGLRM